MLEALDRIIAGLDRGQRLERQLDTPGLGPVQPLVAELAARPWPGPRESLLALRRLVEQGQVRDWPRAGTALQALAGLLSSGNELPRLLIRRPRRLELLRDPAPGRAWSRAELEAGLERELDGAVNDADFAERLAAFRNDHYVRLAACEFLLPTLEQVGQELSTLADVCLERTLAHVDGQLAAAVGPPLCHVEGRPTRCRVAALALGKHGARELNFCSDIDLVFIYTADEGAAGELTLHEYFTRLCQRATRLLSEPTPEGYAFRVDLRLRPEGSRGPICNSLASAERYYETWGGPYDRLAWLKGRAAAGDLRLGREMVRIMRPFVFPRALRAEVVEQIEELYRRVDAEARKGTAVRGWNVKLQRGGIRQIEFLVQALQLLHGGKHTALQEPTTLAALDRLLFRGLITEHEHRLLGEAYELWRRIEHRLQLFDGRQTHLLPDDGPRRRHLALHLGLEPTVFDQEVARRRREVEAVFDTLGSAGAVPTADAPVPLSLPADASPPALAALLEPTLPRPERVALLRGAGFAAAERAAEQLELLADRPWGPLGSASPSTVRRLALPLLEELCRSPDPDAALVHVVALTLRYGPYHGPWELLEHNRSTLRLLMSLFGASDHLARLFIDHPELMEHLLGAGRARLERDLGDMRAELTARLSRIEADDTEGRLNLLRRFRNEEVLRIGLHDIAGGLEIESVWAQLSDLARAILEQTYPLVWREATARYGVPMDAAGQPASMAVLALGKLGGRELSYASDLDLIFVYSDEGATDARAIANSELFARLAQRLIGALSVNLEEGRLYEVDTRLRPSGNQGTLVVSWPAFRDYHRQRAEPWERQVLIKLRAVAGDLELGRQVEQWAAGAIFFGEPSEDPAPEMDRHRRRMEKELAGENGDFYNLKLGRGGLLDIDFIVQCFQLRHGGRYRSLRVRSTLEALASLKREGLIDTETADRLERGYRFLRRLESRLRIVRDRAADRLPRRAEGLEVMARRLGYRQQRDTTPGSRLLADYLETTRSIRAIYEQIFTG